MPEPDFEQIARLIGEETGAAGLDEWEYGAFDRALAYIAEQLRQVWNARGAADVTAVDAKLGEMWATVGPMIPGAEPHPPGNVSAASRLVSGAIRKLDR